MHTRVFRHTFLWISGWLLLTGFSSEAETVRCKQKINAFDCAEPTRQIGYFQDQSELEIEEFVPAAKMYRVRLKTPDGTEVHALCRPEDVGKTPPSKESKERVDGFESKPEEPEVSPADRPSFESPPPPPQSSSQPPIFVSVTLLEPSLWDTTSKSFALKQGSYGFRPISLTEQDVLRSISSLTFMKNPVLETIARFKDDKLREMTLLFYGRGDVKKNLDEGEFQSFMKKVETSLDDWLKTRGVEAWVPGNVADTQRKSWFKTPLRVDLEWSITRNASETEGGFGAKPIVKKGFRAEFIRLNVTSYDGKQSIAELTKPDFRSAPKTSTVKRADIKGRVKHEDGGDVYLDGVPMVDQGDKGYCVVASSERVMRYFGLDFDQNELAKIANSNAAAGTSEAVMFKALQKICSQFSLIPREHKKFDFKEFLKEAESYNHLAKREKKNEVDVPKSGMINITEVYLSMDPGVLREVRLKKIVEKNKFTTDVMELIDSGVPALWSVMLGYVPETPELHIQGRGGHMRLIIGYNKKTTEIIYTDSWGMGHEFKRMKLEDAFFITSGLFSVRPST